MLRVLVLLVVPLLLLGRGLWYGLELCTPRAVRADFVESESQADGWRDAPAPALAARLELTRQLGDGALPVWRPLEGLGAPLAAGEHGAPWDPLRWLDALFGPRAAAAWIALQQLFLAGAGAWLFLERRGLAFGACALGALGLQSAGFTAGSIVQPAQLGAALWLPWTLWALEGLLAGRRWAGLACSLSVCATFLTGSMAVALGSAAAAGAFALVRTIELRDLAAARRSLTFLALGVAGAALQLIPALEASWLAPRDAPSAAQLAARALPWESLATLVSPTLLHDPRSSLATSSDALAWLWTGDAARLGDAARWSLFAGVGTLALALVGVLLEHRRARALLIVGGVALLTALALPPLDHVLHVPLLGSAALDGARAVLACSLALLAGFGAQALLERRPGALLVPALLGGVLVAAGAGLASWAEPDRWLRDIHVRIATEHGLDPTMLRAQLDEPAIRESGLRVKAAGVGLAASALVLLGAIVLAGSRDPERRSSVPALVFGFALAFEGARAGSLGVAWRVPRDPEPPSAMLSALHRAAAGGRVLRLSHAGATRGALPPFEALEGVGIADATVALSSSPRRVRELLLAAGLILAESGDALLLSDANALGHPLLDLLDIEAVLSSRPLEHPRLSEEWSGGGLYVYRRAGASGRARVVAHAVLESDDSQALAVLSSQALDLQRVFIAADATHLEQQPAAPLSKTQVTVRASGPDRFEAQVSHSPGGWLVVHEAWHPGWRADVDGRAAEVVRADHALRAVRIPAGDCTVRMRYAPRSFVLGAWVSAVALASAFIAVRRYTAA